ncbi:TPA: bifunctional phosphoglucose/phosphomannose isomerase [Candidatus Saccharibacteria bacterium]|nr:bifunctional phosphoglucose/phosphomannose isomerase [Candidatus Saccharibacteria bacterium]HRF28061.1 bifunctional phosphoglucose/phosphomannose isomerase [Candidatus Saccharibacteria bacterium]HRJ91215.1 bifunctional phosphoglucose/phosphomannose isomerase [Candidatus Saccharibacteria bacterium]
MDDMNVIAQIDTFDALGLAANTPEQLRHDFAVQNVSLDRDIRNVVFAGMGGSALQAEFIKTWPSLSAPFVIWRDYNLPNFVDEHTLVLVASYSGNTEETLSSLATAREKGAMVAVMAGGGKLQEEAEAHGDIFVQIPKAVQPRMAVFYSFRILVEVLVAHGLAKREVLAELEAASKVIESIIPRWVKEIPTEENEAKQIAKHLVGKTPIFYAGTLMTAAAYKWKIGVNENAKNTSWYNLMPEFNHNEFMGWTSHPVEKPFAVVDLISSYEHPRILRRFEVSDRLLSGMRPKALQLHAEGNSILEQLLYLVMLGDFATIYMGILNGVDPSPVALIEKFKKELG